MLQQESKPSHSQSKSEGISSDKHIDQMEIPFKTKQEPQYSLIDLQTTQEYILLIQISILLISLMISQQIQPQFSSLIRQIFVITYFVILILTQIITQFISNTILKYILFCLYTISKLVAIYLIGYLYIAESILLILILVYFSIYFILKSSYRIKGLNKLQVKQYLIHILIYSLIFSLVINQEIQTNRFFVLLLFLIMLLYSIYLLLNLQMVEFRSYLIENKDYYTSSILVDSDLLIPANLLQYHIPDLFKSKQAQVEEIEKENSSDSENDESEIEA